MPQKCYETHEGAFAIFLSHSLQGGMKDFIYFFALLKERRWAIFHLVLQSIFWNPHLTLTLQQD